MINVNVQIKGMKRTLKKIQRFGDVEVKKRVDRGLRRSGQHLFDEAYKLTPEDTGALRDSMYGGMDYPVKKSARGYYTVVGYDSKKVSYAWRLHEDMPGTWKGKPRRNGNGRYWDPGGEPEFLWKAWARNVGKIARIMRRELKR